MRIELEYDCSNVDEVARQIFEKKVKPFNYEIPKDGWDKLLEKGESTYKEEKKMKFKVKALINFNDLEENKHRVIGEVFECSKARCDYLLEHKAIEILEEINSEVKVSEKFKTETEVPEIENIEEKIEEIKESAKEEVELNKFGNPVGTREMKPKKKKSSKK